MVHMVTAVQIIALKTARGLDVTSLKTQENVYLAVMLVITVITVMQHVL